MRQAIDLLIILLYYFEILVCPQKCEKKLYFKLFSHFWKIRLYKNIESSLLKSVLLMNPQVIGFILKCIIRVKNKYLIIFVRIFNISP